MLKTAAIIASLLLALAAPARALPPELVAKGKQATALVAVPVAFGTGYGSAVKFVGP